MGRHGGGSRSGGRSGGSRHSGGSRNSGSRARISKKPFYGCYDRSYYDRRGRFHACYSQNSSFGTKKGWNSKIAFALIFITMHMIIMLSGFASSIIQFGSKIEGNKNRIFIEDRVDVLTSFEETKILALFQKIYDKSGMPITLYTDDFSWKEHYYSLEVYSEELYYQNGYDEAAMLILFTANNSDGFFDWEYDIYCGDETIKCFSDTAFNKLLDNFQKSMSNQNLAEALDYSWSSVVDNMVGISINWRDAPVLLFILLFYGIFYISIFSNIKKNNASYVYFKDNPDKLSMSPMTLYNECPNCGASNATQKEICEYCGTLLKVNDGNTIFINPNGE